VLSFPVVERLASEEKPPKDNPTDAVAVDDTEAELVEVEVLVVAAVDEALVAIAVVATLFGPTGAGGLEK
jgi:hypothetical protein